MRAMEQRVREEIDRDRLQRAVHAERSEPPEHHNEINGLSYEEILHEMRAMEQRVREEIDRDRSQLVAHEPMHVSPCSSLCDEDPEIEQELDALLDASINAPNLGHSAAQPAGTRTNLSDKEYHDAVHEDDRMREISKEIDVEEQKREDAYFCFTTGNFGGMQIEDEDSSSPVACLSCGTCGVPLLGNTECWSCYDEH